MNNSIAKFNKTILESAAVIASKVGIKKIFIYTETIDGFDILKDLSRKFEITLITRSKDLFEKGGKLIKNVFNVTGIKMTRTGQVKMAVMKGLSAGLIEKGDKILCLSGVSEFGILDNIVILDISKEFEMLTSEAIPDIAEELRNEVFESILNLAVEFASQGREGKPIGTIFILGDHEKVMQLSRQMIINPFKGYAEEERNILDENLKETIREFSALDGAFVIREDGVIMAAGTYISASSEQNDVPHGLGARHVAAAGITSITDSTAIVISESTGTVRIYKNGKMFMEIERSG